METFPFSFAAPILYYSNIIKTEKFEFDTWSAINKNAYRSRYLICNANGKLLLTIPLINATKDFSFEKVEISYKENWQKNHLKSLEASYKKSPYFDFFWDEISPIYQTRFTNLMEICEISNRLINRILSIKPSESIALKENRVYPANHEKLEAYVPKEYYQVFSERLGFIPNLSILDLIMNEGNSSINYI